jgi:hypothetical protein
MVVPASEVAQTVRVAIMNYVVFYLSSFLDGTVVESIRDEDNRCAARGLRLHTGHWSQ